MFKGYGAQWNFGRKHDLRTLWGGGDRSHFPSNKNASAQVQSEHT